MSAARRCAVATHAAILLMLAGLMLAEFVGLTRLGMVIGLVGLIVYGISVGLRYSAWDSRHE